MKTIFNLKVMHDRSLQISEWWPFVSQYVPVSLHRTIWIRVRRVGLTMEWRLGKATQVQKWHQLLWGQSKGPSPESPQGLSQLSGILGLSMFLEPCKLEVLATWKRLLTAYVV